MAQENLNIVIRAFDKTSAGFRKVRDGLGGISKRILNVKTAVAGLGGALALRQFSQQIDDIAKQSDRLGHHSRTASITTVCRIADRFGRWGT